MYNKFWLILILKCSDIEHSSFKTNGPEKYFPEHNLIQYFSSFHYNKSQYWQFNRNKQKKKTMYLNYQIKKGHKWNKNVPFPHFYILNSGFIKIFY